MKIQAVQEAAGGGVTAAGFAAMLDGLSTYLLGVPLPVFLAAFGGALIGNARSPVAEGTAWFRLCRATSEVIVSLLFGAWVAPLGLALAQKVFALEGNLMVGIAFLLSLVAGRLIPAILSAASTVVPDIYKRLVGGEK